MPGILMRNGKVLYDKRTGKILYGEPGDACCCSIYDPEGCAACPSWASVYASAWSGTSGGLTVPTSNTGWFCAAGVDSIYVCNATGIYLLDDDVLINPGGADTRWVFHRTKWDVFAVRRKVVRYRSKVRQQNLGGDANRNWGSRVSPFEGEIFRFVHNGSGDGSVSGEVRGNHGITTFTTSTTVDIVFDFLITLLAGGLARVRTRIFVNGELKLGEDDFFVECGWLCGNSLRLGLYNFGFSTGGNDANWGTDTLVTNFSVEDSEW